MIDLKGHAALVTGSTKGVGRSIVEAFARAGADVVVSARQPSDLADQVVAGCRQSGVRAEFIDMQKHGEDEKYWADDIFLQATAWYLNLPIRIIYAGDDTGGRIAATTDGDFFPPIDGEQRPLLYLGYIVNEHYQSLLPVVEDDYVPPPGLAQPAVGNALQNALQALLEEKAKQGTEVSS